MADPVGRVCVAFADGPLAPNPTWTRLDNDDSFVAEIEISTGRQTEFDQTETGSAIVRFNDTEGLLDPMNASSPYYGNLDGKQLAVSMWDPVQQGWFIRFRGVIDEYGYGIRPSQVVSDVQMVAVDVFDYLAGVQFLPGVHGNTLGTYTPPPAGSEGTVFYEDGPVETRLDSLLYDAGINSAMYVTFSGNVNVIETLYDPGDSVLVGLRDAADAEAPTIANIYVDRFGRFVFHGRYARLDPEGVIADGPVGTTEWDFQTWDVGDGDAIAAAPGTEWAHLRPPFSYRRSRNRIVNAALCYPRQNAGLPFAEADMPGQVWQDATSQTDYGTHSWSATDLIIKERQVTLESAKTECLNFAKFVVANNKDPQTRVEALTIRSISTAHAAATGTWRMLSRADISDRVLLSVGYPGGTGLAAAPFFIEGWTQTIRPGSPIESGGVDFVELNLNVSPAPVSFGPFPDPFS